MKLFDVGQEAHGVIAIGQFATGVFAFGQVATGVVAIGQVARGVFVVGQLAFGVVCVGQLAFGLHTAIAMLGLAGRRGRGAVLELFPRREPPEGLPELVPASEVMSGARNVGWSRVRVAPRRTDAGEQSREVVLLDERNVLEVDLEPPATARLHEIAGSDWPIALVRLEARNRLAVEDVSYREAAPTERYVAALEARPSPRPEWTQPVFWFLGTVRLLAFAALCAAYWFFVAADLVAMFAAG